MAVPVELLCLLLHCTLRVMVSSQGRPSLLSATPAQAAGSTASHRLVRQRLLFFYCALSFLAFI
jgi:hypothetical protein